MAGKKVLVLPLIMLESMSGKLTAMPENKEDYQIIMQSNKNIKKSKQLELAIQSNTHLFTMMEKVITINLMLQDQD